MGYFAKFYKLLYFIIAIHKHAISKISNLLHFLDSWVDYREEKGIPMVRPKRIPPSCWRVGPRKEKQS
jgi:hypothetical protein